ncbi:MAG: alpha/beta fold hydrolase [Archangium sp.]|nr:alpha/beta fold hydrolase [Archangium sp.]
MNRVRPNKSTNVRLLNGLVSLAERVAPAWVEEKAFGLWARPRRTPAKWGQALSGARAFRLEAGGAALAAWEWNVNGPHGSALLVHGWSGNASQLSSFVEPLVQRGYHVVAMDLPAHGQTAGNFATVPLLAHTVAELGQRLRPRIVVAHSLGATSTGYALTKGLRPERLALLAPPAQLPPYLAHFAQQAGLSDAMQARLLRRVEQIIGRPVSELDLRVHAPALGHVRALLVHDRDDSVVPLESSRELAALWPAARLVVTVGLSHDRIRRDPGVVEQVVSFVTGQAAQDALPSAAWSASAASPAS